MENLTNIIDRIKAIVEGLDGNLPDGIDSISDFENIEYAKNAIYVHWINTTFTDEDEADEFLKNYDGSFYAARKGYIEYENRPTIYNNYSGCIDDGEVWVNNINEVEKLIEELKEISDELNDLNIFIKDTDFKDIITDIKEQFKELEEELEE